MMWRGVEDPTGMDVEDTRWRSLLFIHDGHVYEP
jgi:hypothetical protein